MWKSRRLIARTIILGALWFAASAPPLKAGYCDEVCYPTCDDYQGHCAEMGGWSDGLCGCLYSQYGDGGVSYGCNLPSCQWVGGGGNGGDSCPDDDPDCFEI